MKLRFLVSVKDHAQTYAQGAVVDINDDEARELVASGLAVAVELDAQDPDASDDAEKPAAKPAKKAKA